MDDVSKTAEGAEAYFQEYVFGVADFDAYLEKIGGRQAAAVSAERLRNCASDRTRRPGATLETRRLPKALTVSPPSNGRRSINDG